MKLELELAPAQIDLLREVIDELPLNKYVTLVAGLLPQLPILDHVPTVQPLATAQASGMTFTAFTPRGVAMLEALDDVLATSDHDPTPWCNGCGAKTRARCDCGPIADNE